MTLRTSLGIQLDLGAAKASLAKLTNDFKSAGSDIDRTLGTSVGRRLDSITDQVSGLGGLSRTLGPIGGTAAAAGVGLAALGTAVVGATTAIFTLTKAQAEGIARTRQFADNIGVNIEEFSALARVAADFGAEAEDVADTIKDLSVRAFENEKEFRELGISVRDVNGQLLQGVPLYLRVADAITGMSDATEQAAVIDILASDAGVRNIEVLRQGSAAIREQTEAYRASGAVITEESARINKEFITAVRAAEASFDDLTRMVGTEFAEAFTPVMLDAVRLLNENRDAVHDWVEGFVGGVSDILQRMPALLQSLGQTLETMGGIGLAVAVIGGVANPALAPLAIQLAVISAAAGRAGTELEGLGKQLEDGADKWQTFNREARTGADTLADLTRLEGSIFDVPAVQAELNPQGPASRPTGQDPATEARKKLNDELLKLERSLLTDRERINLEFGERLKQVQLRLSGEREAEAAELVDAVRAKALADLEAKERAADEQARARAMAQVDAFIAAQEAEAAALQAAEERRQAILTQYRGDDPVERLRAQLAAELEVVRQAEADKTLAIEEAWALRDEITQRANARILEAERRATAQSITSALNKASTIVGVAGSTAQSISQIEANLAGESAQRSEELFYIQQGINAVQAGINTALAITRAWAELGPIAGTVAAVAIGLAGAFQVASILSAKPGSPPTPTGGTPSIPSTPARASFDEPERRSRAPDQFAAATNVNVSFNGPVDSRRAAREIRDVMNA